MAAFAITNPRGPVLVANTDTNTKSIITAIEKSQQENIKAHEKNREAISDVTLKLAQLSSDVGHMGEAISELRTAVGALDKEKISRAEVAALEERIVRAIEQYKIQNKLDMDSFRVRVEERFENVRQFKIDRADLNPESVTALIERVASVEDKADANASRITSYEDKAKGGWIVLGQIGLIGSAILSSIAFAVHEFLAIAKHP